MVVIRLVTVEGCPRVCEHCATAEAVLRKVLAVAGVEMPEHADDNRVESHLADGRVVEVAHVPCDEADDVDRAQAPVLFVDGERVVHGGRWDADALAEAVLEALLPDGLAGLRP